nr:hypothetical protein [Mycoplasmopsis agalactiae]
MLNNSPVISEAETLWSINLISASASAASLASSALAFLSDAFLIASVYVSSKILPVISAALILSNVPLFKSQLSFKTLLAHLFKSSLVQWMLMSKPEAESL